MPATLPPDRLPRRVHNPTTHTNYPMSDRDWLAFAAAYRSSEQPDYLRWLWPPHFDDPTLPTTEQALRAMWEALGPVYVAWEARVGVRRALKWRDARLDRKVREHQHAALWAASDATRKHLIPCAREETARSYIGVVGLESIDRVLRRDEPGGPWRDA